MGELKINPSTPEGTKFEIENVTLKYRAHIRYLYYWLNIMGGIFLATASLGFYFLMNDPKLVNLVIFPATIGVGSLLQARFLFKPMVHFSGVVKGNSFVMNRMGKEIILNFEDISEVEFSHLKSIGGWFTIHLKNKEKYKFTIVLENGHLLLNAIKSFNADLVEEKKFDSFLFTQIYSDQSWIRLYAKCRQWPKLLLKYVGYPIILACGLFFTGWFFKTPAKLVGLGVFIVMLGSTLPFMIGYFIEEFLASRFLKKEIKKDPNAFLGVTKVDLSKKTKIPMVSWIFSLLFVVSTYGLIIFASLSKAGQ